MILDGRKDGKVCELSFSKKKNGLFSPRTRFAFQSSLEQIDIVDDNGVITDKNNKFENLCEATKALRTEYKSFIDRFLGQLEGKLTPECLAGIKADMSKFQELGKERTR